MMADFTRFESVINVRFAQQGAVVSTYGECVYVAEADLLETIDPADVKRLLCNILLERHKEVLEQIEAACKRPLPPLSLSLCKLSAGVYPLVLH